MHDKSINEFANGMDNTSMDTATLRETSGVGPETTAVDGSRNPRKANPQSPAPVSGKRRIPIWAWIVGGVLLTIVVIVLLLLSIRNQRPEIEPVEPDRTAQDVPWSMSKADNGDYIIKVGDLEYIMKYVEGGTFTMGYANDRYQPAHQVTLSSYWIGETEVTQALWTAVMDENPSYELGDSLPVDMIKWSESLRFRKKFNEKLRDKLPEGCRFALPTEAEWEYAARGGKHSKHYKYAGSNDIDEVAWYDENSDGKTHPVKSKKANELGLYDMCGNTWEWCADWYGEYSRTPQTNPTGPSSGWARVCRGGASGNSGLLVGERSEPDMGPEERGAVGVRLVLAPRQ